MKSSELYSKYSLYSRIYEAVRGETRNAVTDGLACPQPFMRPEEYSEDCLHLSV